MCGFLPFEDPDTAQLYKKILKGKYLVPKFISASVTSLIDEILIRDPEDRPSISQIRKHPWFQINQPVCQNKGIIVGYSQMHHDSKVLLELEKLSLLQSNMNTASQLNSSTEGAAGGAAAPKAPPIPPFDREHTIRCLDANKHNHHTTCYYLMLSKLQAQGKISPLSQYRQVVQHTASAAK